MGQCSWRLSDFLEKEFDCDSLEKTQTHFRAGIHLQDKKLYYILVYNQPEVFFLLLVNIHRNK